MAAVRTVMLVHVASLPASMNNAALRKGKKTTLQAISSNTLVESIP
jgi:hypothetical protein